MTGPRVSSGRDSKQDYATPAEFIRAVERRFGPIVFDLAAHAGNAKAPRWYSPGGVVEDAPAQSWAIDPARPQGLFWLNPPFSDIAPWAAKCCAAGVRGLSIALLVPAAVGSNWFRDLVAPHADVYLLNGRLCFDGQNLFPKDCLLAVYGGRPGMRIWEWKKDLVHACWSEPLSAFAAATRRAGSRA